jgi:hypothetical protein
MRRPSGEKEGKLSYWLLSVSWGRAGAPGVNAKISRSSSTTVGLTAAKAILPGLPGNAALAEGAMTATTTQTTASPPGSAVRRFALIPGLYAKRRKATRASTR